MSNSNQNYLYKYISEQTDLAKPEAGKSANTAPSPDPEVTKKTNQINFNQLAITLHNELEKTLPGKEGDILMAKGVPKSDHLNYYVNLFDAYNKKYKEMDLLKKLLDNFRQKPAVRHGIRAIITSLTYKGRIALFPIGINYNQVGSNMFVTDVLKFIGGFLGLMVIAPPVAADLVAQGLALIWSGIGIAGGHRKYLRMHNRHLRRVKYGSKGRGPAGQGGAASRRRLDPQRTEPISPENMESFIDNNISEFSAFVYIKDQEDRTKLDFLFSNLKKLNQELDAKLDKIVDDDYGSANRKKQIAYVEHFNKTVSMLNKFGKQNKDNILQLEDGYRDLVKAHLETPIVKQKIAAAKAVVKKAINKKPETKQPKATQKKDEKSEPLAVENVIISDGLLGRGGEIGAKLSFALVLNHKDHGGTDLDSFMKKNKLKRDVAMMSKISKKIYFTIIGLKSNIKKSFTFDGDKTNDNIESILIYPTNRSGKESTTIEVVGKTNFNSKDARAKQYFIDKSAPIVFWLKYPNPTGKTLDGQVDMKNEGSNFGTNSTNANTQAQGEDKGELAIGLPEEKLTQIQNKVTSRYTSTNKPLVKLVSELQYYLHKNNYAAGSQDRFVDGVFGPRTLTALVKAANSFLPEPEQINESVGVSNLRSKLRSRKDIEKDAERLYKSLTGLGSGGALKILKKYLGDLEQRRESYWRYVYGTKENPKNRKGDEEVILLYWQYSKILNRNRETSSGDLINWLLDESSNKVKYYGRALYFILMVHNVNRTWAGIDLKDNIRSRTLNAVRNFLEPDALRQFDAYELVKRMGKTPPFGKPKENVAKMGSRAVNKIRKFSQVLTRGARKSIEQQSGWTIKVKKYKSGKFVAMMKREDMKSGSDRLNKYFSNKTTGPFAADINKAIATLTNLSDAERRNVRKTFSGASAKSMAEFQIIARGKKIGILLPGYLFADSQTEKYADNSGKTKSSEKSADKAKTQGDKKTASKPDMAKPENFIPRYIGRIRETLRTLENQPSVGGPLSKRLQQIINKLKNKNDPRAKNIVEVSKLLLEVYKRRKK